MPSFGGPPERISAKSTVAREKSVSGQAAAQRAANREAMRAEREARGGEIDDETARRRGLRGYRDVEP